MSIRILVFCREALKRLDDYLDRELSPTDMKWVRWHLKQCIHCSRKFAFEASVLRQVRSKLSRIAVPPSLLLSIRHALDEAEEAAIRDHDA